MAVSSCAMAFSAFECRSDPDFSRTDAPSARKIKPPMLQGAVSAYGLSSLIFKFPPNFVRQLSNKARRNCSNIGVAQVVAASWSNGHDASGFKPAAKAADAAAAAAASAASAPVEAGVDEVVAVASAPVEPGVDEVVVAEDTTSDPAAAASAPVETGVDEVVVAENTASDPENVQSEVSPPFKYASFLNFDGSVAIHAGERLGRDIVTDAITTPVVNTSAYFFKKTADLIDFKEKRRASFEYGRYGNYTTIVAEEKISALEGAESTLLMASGMCASTALLMALVPAGGHLVTTTDCYRKTRIFIETILPKMGITATVIDPADVGGLKSALEKNNVSLYFTESPTNPFLRCVDIELVSKLCHDKGALVCIDGTFATPFNQKALALGADIVLHSATKFIGGHNDVLAGSISGPEKLVSAVRNLHHILGGVLNPNAAYLIIRGMKTLHLRVQQQNSTAQKMAEILEAHSKVRRVYYPGLVSHPEHQLAKKQMTGFGGVVSFEVDGDLHTTAKFVDSLQIPYIAPSFGGCESIVDQPAIMSYWDLPQVERAKYGILDNLVRFSFGVEDFEDLKADILQALETI